MQTPYAPIMVQDATKVVKPEPVRAVVHPLSQTQGYLAWAAGQSNPNVEDYEKFLQNTQKNKSVVSQGRELTEQEKRESQQKLELHGQLEKEAQDRQKAGEVVLEGLNYISPSYWANQAGLQLNGAESFLVDIVGDPTTYLSFGAIPVTKAVGKKAVKEGAEKAVKEATERKVRGEIVQSMTPSKITHPIENPFNFGPNVINQINGAYATAVQMLSPGGAWYERQLANGMSKADVEKLAKFYLSEIDNSVIGVSPKLAGAWGKARIVFPDGASRPLGTITIDATGPDKVGTTLHELSHIMTRNAETRIPINVDAATKETYQKVLQGHPELYEAIKHNTDMFPLKRKPEYERRQLFNNNQQEIRARAFGAEADAALKQVDIDTYVNTPQLWGQQMQQLAQVFDLESIRQFLHNYKAIVPAVGTAGAILSTDGQNESFKKGGSIHIKKKNKGKFTDYCGGKVTEDCIRKGKNSSNPTTRKRATFAQNARRWKHQEGGKINYLNYFS